MDGLKIGDVVQLKSGGPKMVVEKIGTPSMAGEKGEVIHAWVAWIDDKKISHKEVYPLTSLKMYEARKRANIKFRH